MSTSSCLLPSAVVQSLEKSKCNSLLTPPRGPLQTISLWLTLALLLVGRICSKMVSYLNFPRGSVVKNLPANAGDAGDMSSIPGSGRSPVEGNGSPLQYSCLGNFMDREAWWTTGSQRVGHNWPCTCGFMRVWVEVLLKLREHWFLRLCLHSSLF